MVAVPIDVTCQVIDRLGNPPLWTARWWIVTSGRVNRLPSICWRYTRAGAGLHPMFGPGRGESPAGVIVCRQGTRIPSPASGCWNR